MTGLRRDRPMAMLAMIAGFLVWSSCFTLLYGLLSVGCELQWQHRSLLGVNLLSLLLALLWGLHLLLLGLLLRASLRRRHSGPGPGGFLHRTTLLLHASAFGATVWFAFPLLVLPPCS